jgi:hypothetical protein
MPKSGQAAYAQKWSLRFARHEPGICRSFTSSKSEVINGMVSGEHVTDNVSWLLPSC